MGSLPFSYLGIRIGGLRGRKNEWQEVVQKVRSRLKKWEGRKISIEGRVTLINSVLSSIPTYFISMYKVPKAIIKEFIKLQRNFLWGGGVDDKKLAWISWHDICKEKEAGGLGVKDLELFNMALLGKWIWRYLNNDSSLWAKVIHSRWGENWLPGREIRTRGQGGVISGWWSDVLATGGGWPEGWMVSGLRKEVGDGRKTRFLDEVCI